MYTEKQQLEAGQYFGMNDKKFMSLLRVGDDTTIRSPYVERVNALMDWIEEKINGKDIEKLTGEDMKKFICEYYYNIIKSNVHTLP